MDGRPAFAVKTGGVGQPLPHTATCVHCRTPFRPTPQRPDFCCAGCQFVHGLIEERGLDRFYQMQAGPVQPVGSVVFRKRNDAWLTELAKLAEADAGAPPPTLCLDVQGVSCIGCVWLIERLFQQRPGALEIQINPSLGQMKIRWTSGAFDAAAFARELQSFGYLVGPASKTSATESGRLGLRLGLCGAFAMNAMLFALPDYLGMEAKFEFAPLFHRLGFLFATLSLLTGGSTFIRRAVNSLRHGMLHMDLPIALGITAAYASSLVAWQHGEAGFLYFDFVSIFIFLMLTGRWLQQRAVERNRHLLLDQYTEPEPVRLHDSDAIQPIHDLKPGQRYLAAPGQMVPVRSRLLSASAALGLEWINGESDSRAVREGQLVPSGALNTGRDAIALEAVETWPDSALAMLLQVVPRGAFRHAGLERFIRGYILTVVGIALAAFFAWILTGHPVLKALQVLTSILVVSCPCAAGMALPLADDLAAGRLRRAGVFLRESSLWSRLKTVRKIIFDKTGTLTLETMVLRRPEALERLASHEKEALLATVENSLHPVSCCLRETLLAGGTRLTEAARRDPVEETVGAGLERRSPGENWRLGRPDWAGAAGATTDAQCAWTRNGRTLAEFSFGEELRSDAVEEVAALRERGCEVYLLSGDRRSKVAEMARRLDLPEAHGLGEMSPVAKGEWLRHLDAHDTLMIGDGANDSLAFNASWCCGTPAIDRGLLEQKADFYFLGRGLGGVRALLDAAHLRERAIRGTLTFTINYNILAVAASCAGWMNPLVAAIIMPLSSALSMSIVLALLRGRPGAS